MVITVDEFLFIYFFCLYCSARCIYIFFLFTWGVWTSLHVSRLILTDPEVKDQLSLQWLLILTTTRLEPKTTGKTNSLILNSYIIIYLMFVFIFSLQSKQWLIYKSLVTCQFFKFI